MKKLKILILLVGFFKIYGGYAACNLYIVQKGDNYSKIAQKYNISIRELEDLNGISEYGLKVGQTICISDAETPPPQRTNKLDIKTAIENRFRKTQLINENKNKKPEQKIKSIQQTTPIKSNLIEIILLIISFIILALLIFINFQFRKKDNITQYKEIVDSLINNNGLLENLPKNIEKLTMLFNQIKVIQQRDLAKNNLKINELIEFNNQYKNIISELEIKNNALSDNTLKQQNKVLDNQLKRVIEKVKLLKTKTLIPQDLDEIEQVEWIIDGIIKDTQQKEQQWTDYSKNQSQNLNNNHDINILLDPWLACYKKLMALEIQPIESELKNLKQILIQPTQQQQSLNKADLNALSQILANFEDILYWHEWLALPIDKTFINTLAHLLDLSKAMILQFNYYIHKYPFDLSQATLSTFKSQFELIQRLCPQISLSNLILDNMRDLLILFNETKGSEDDKIKALQTLFKTDAPLICPHSTELQTDRINRQRIYGLNYLALEDMIENKSIITTEILCY